MGYEFTHASRGERSAQSLYLNPPGDFSSEPTRDGELTVRALTGRAGVSQPGVSKHLRVFKPAGLVRDRRDGRETYYRAGAGSPPCSIG